MLAAKFTDSVEKVTSLDASLTDVRIVTKRVRNETIEAAKQDGTPKHRIVDAIDALASTAASHQRSFVVEVMGRHCGYLALMAAIAGGCDYVLIPENPPADGWEERMCAELKRGRDAGRRDSIVLVAEGARDRQGDPITSEYVRSTLETRLGEDARVTILGHVQRGGAPSAYDRWAMPRSRRCWRPARSARAW